MRLAVFVNQFPGRVSTFFARDMRGLLASGVAVDIFPIYPLDQTLWRYVPDILNERVLPRTRVHHISLDQTLRSLKPWAFRKLATFAYDTAAISTSALRYGATPLVKSIYVFLKAWVWAQQFPHHYDHILAYWGNYTASCAYVYHRLTARRIPFSIFLHAGIDLYRNPVYLRQKFLYSTNIITCSEFNKQFIHEHFSDIYDRIREKIFVHHHGLDFSEFPYEINGRAPRRVIAVGRLERQKGFDFLLQAVQKLALQGLDFELELIGDGHQATTLKTLAHELQIVERVKFRGWLPFQEVRTTMSQATVLVHPSPDLGDGVPNVIKEAMALGTPVIGSSVAGIPELLGNGRYGVLVPPKDINALADAISRVLADDMLRLQYVRAAREHAEKKFDLWRNGQCLADRLRSIESSKSLSVTAS